MAITPPVPQISDDFAAAREYVKQGKLQDAERAFRNVLATNPDHPEALRFLANAALARGNPAEAVNMLTKAVDSDRNDSGLLLELGIAYRAGQRLDAARYVFERVVTMGSDHRAPARLLLANVLELDQRPELALPQYFLAILEAQHAGRWLDDSTTDPGLRQLVRHAMDYVARERRALFERDLQRLRWDGALEPASRVNRALSIYLRERKELPADPFQKPTFLYVPDMETGRFLEARQFPWLNGCSQRMARLTSEVDACLNAAAASSSSNPFGLDTLLGSAETRAEPPKTPSLVSIYKRGTPAENADSCATQLMAILDSTPLVRIHRHGPDAEIVALDPGVTLPVSYGRTNSRVVVAICMETSADLDVVVGGERTVLEAGQTVIFDSTFGYEYSNRSTSPCRALTFEVWHPDLSRLEQKAIETLTATAVDFDASLQELLQT